MTASKHDASPKSIAESLIEKLEARVSHTVNPSMQTLGQNQAFVEAIAIIRQHRPEQPQDVVERVAIALSMADPDERGLPEGIEMGEFYRVLAKAAITAMGDGSATIAPVSAESQFVSEQAFRDGFVSGYDFRQEEIESSGNNSPMNQEEIKDIADFRWDAYSSQMQSRVSSESVQPISPASSLIEALLGLKYSHGCWCDPAPKGGELHSRACANAQRALNAMGDASTRKDGAQAHGMESSDSVFTTLPKLGDASNTGSPSEISVVDEETIKETIRKVVSLVMNTQQAAVIGMLDLIYIKLRPYLRQPEPVSVEVSLEGFTRDMLNNMNRHDIEEEEAVKVTLEKHGVKYVD